MSYNQSFKQEIWNLSSDDFNEKALDLFIYQAQNNKIYQKYLKSLNVDPFEVKFLEEIPFMPIEFFKHHQVVTGAKASSFYFESSGTTESGRSRHYLMDPEFYLKVCMLGFERFYGNPGDYKIFGLLPNYMKNPHSSLIYMVDFLIKKGIPGSGYVQSGEDLIREVKSSLNAGEKPVIFGVTFALLDLAEKFSEDLEGLILIETGGMKGRREEITRAEFHGILKKAFNLTNIHSEYGMCELNSQAYALADGQFILPSWMKVFLRDMNDPFSKANVSGGINIIDLANIDSCAFIETKDIGRINGDFFEVLGRFDNSDVRGCSQLTINI
ncbi:MAG: acyl transferase [Cytophagaceae bacterium]